MTRILILLLLCLNLLNINAMSVLSQKPEELDLELKKTSLKQGEFFQAYLKGYNKKLFGHRPRIWFNAKEFEFFEIEDKSTWMAIDPKKRKKKNKIYRALIPVENLTKPGSYSVLARLGDWEERIPVKIRDNEKEISRITLSDDKSGISASAKELNEVGSALRSRSETKLWHDEFIYPSKAAKSSPFGVKRSYNGAPVSSYHKGLDFAAAKGSEVVAPADAKVVEVGYEAEGYKVHGNTVILDHGHRVTSIYMHLSKVDVEKGQVVKQGEKIGEVGHTGISTGPHLHWGVYLSGTSVEPELFVKNEVR